MKHPVFNCVQIEQVKWMKETRKEKIRAYSALLGKVSGYCRNPIEKILSGSAIIIINIAGYVL
jgi:hypothetical protein